MRNFGLRNGAESAVRASNRGAKCFDSRRASTRELEWKRAHLVSPLASRRGRVRNLSNKIAMLVSIHGDRPSAAPSGGAGTSGPDKGPPRPEAQRHAMTRSPPKVDQWCRVSGPALSHRRPLAPAQVRALSSAASGTRFPRALGAAALRSAAKRAAQRHRISFSAPVPGPAARRKSVIRCDQS